MAGYKETPRQKMIGMMYLVLTALLALNVSKDILNAFIIVNEGLETSSKNVISKTEMTQSAFNKALLENPAKVQKFFDKAQLAKKYADELSLYIQDLKTKIVAYADFNIKQRSDDPAKWDTAVVRAKNLAKVESKDNYDKPMEILIGTTEGGENGEGNVLKNKLDEYKKKMISLLDPSLQAEAIKKSPINTEDIHSVTENKVVNWVVGNFYHTVLAADIAIMSKLLIDVKTVESDIVTSLLAEVTGKDFKFDKIAAKVVAESNYILSGSEYKANIFLAAYDSKKAPEIYIGDTNSHVGEKLDQSKFIEGMGVYTRGGGGIGEQKYTGWISVVAPGETSPTYYNFASSYMVGQPSATVSADKMNVFYIGVDNPVTISVPGVANEKVKPSMTSGTLTPKGGGKYIVKVGTGYTETTVNVFADFAGRTTSMGASKFRVKRVPDPVAYIGGVKSGTVNKNVIAASKMIVAKLENFDFDLTFMVTSFTFLVNIKGDIIPTACSGNMLSAAVLQKIKVAPSGTRIYFEDIKAKGPDGTTRTLSPINLKIL
ncbi:MAG: gliding motility protein GldM [Bacteroidetes bacterium]|nr:gliding motility protein GldM [Bacteroidota bacterium]